MATVANTPRITTITLSASSAGPFFVGFRLFDQDAVDIYLDGELLAPHQFSVSAAFAEGFDDNASILLVDPAPIGAEIRIEGAMRPARASDYIPTDPSVLQKINVEFGRLWASVIELRREANRSLRVPQEGPVVDLAAGTAPIWDGEKFTPGPTADTIASAEGYAERAEAAAEIAMSTASFTASSLAALLVDPSPYPEGGVILTRKDAVSFEVAPPDATDEHYTTLGGVKLYELGPVFTSRDRLSAAVARGALEQGGEVSVDGIQAVCDSAASGAASALNDLGVDGVRLLGDVVYARWWTAGVEGDASAAITAANAYANAWYGAAGQAVTLVLEGTLYIANQITLGTTGAGAQKAFNIDAKQAIFRVMAGGNLEATGEIEAIRIVNCMRSTLEFAQIQCYHRCGGISLERCINSIFTNVHIEKFFWRGFWIKGARSTPAAPTSAGLIVTGVTGEEWLNGDAEFADGANFVATGILNESHDVRVVMAHVGWCGLPIHNRAGSVEFISCHPYNGNATGVGVRLHPMGFLNEGASGVNLYDMYGDNGYIIDLGGGLRIHGLQILSGGSTMTQPYVRLSREVVLNSEIANCLEQIGYFTGTYPVSMFKGVVNIAALTPDPTVPVHFTPSYEWGNKNETWRQKFTTIASGSTPDITTIKVGSSASQEIVERYIPNRPSQDSGAYTQVRYGPGYVVYQRGTSSGGDVRVSSSQRVGLGCPTDGSFPLVFYAGDTDVGRFQQGGVFRPAVDNTQSLGVSTYRWSQVYAGTGTINTSDEREKQDIRDLTEAERAVAVRVKSLIRAFRFSDAVALKGGDARVHFGVMAQEVAAAFTAEGLDPMVYGIVCYDAWDDQPATIDSETGEIVEPARTAGDRWGVRYDELLAFMLAVL